MKRVENLEHILDSMRDGVYIVDKNYAMEFANRVIETEFGPWRGKRCFEYFNGLRKPCPKCVNGKVLSGESISSEWSSPMSGKSYRLFSSPLHGPGGDVCKITFLNETTELKRIIKDKEELLRFAMEATNDGIWDWQMDADVLYWSPRCYEMYGYAPDEFKISFRRWMRLIHPDDRDSARRKIERLVSKGEANFEVEFRQRSKDGSWKWVLGKGKVVARSKDGKALRVAGTLGDISGRKRMETDLRETLNFTREIISSAAEGIIVYDRNLNYVLWNRFMETMVGVKQKDVLERNALEVFPHLKEKGIDKLLRRALAGETVSSEDTEYHFKERKGWVSGTYSPHRDSSGDIIGVIGIVKDVTERRKATLAMQEAKEKAEEAAKAKSEFLACMSHEIRTPLNAILGMSELLGESKNLDKEQADYCKLISDASAKLLEVINDILDYSRIDSGSKTIDSTEFSLHEELDSLHRLLSPMTRDKRIEFKLELEPSVPDMALGDPQHLRQVLLNLLGNAIKFTSEGKVALSVRNLEPELLSPVIEFAVSDTGIGVAPHMLQSIFEPFTQEDSTTTRSFGGTGLGLAISKKLSRLMGGDIEVESVKGKGSTFRLSIPLKRCPPPSKEDDCGMEDGVFLKAGLKALVVEDSQSNLILAMKFLRKIGVDFACAADGRKAVELFRTGRFDVVLLDLQAQGMDGYEVAAEMRRIEKRGRTPRTPIIALSAAAPEPAEGQRRLEAGMDEIIAKPATVKTIVTAIMSLCK